MDLEWWFLRCLRLVCRIWRFELLISDLEIWIWEIYRRPGMRMENFWSWDLICYSLDFGISMCNLGFGNLDLARCSRDVGCWILDLRFFDTACCVRAVEFGVLGLELQTWYVWLGGLDFDYGTLDVRVFLLHSWILDLRYWIRDVRCWIFDVRYCMYNFAM